MGIINRSQKTSALFLLCFIEWWCPQRTSLEGISTTFNTKGYKNKICSKVTSKYSTLCLQSSKMHYNIFLDSNLLASKCYLGEDADITCLYQALL